MGVEIEHEPEAAGVTDHAALSNVTANQHHGQSHGHTGADGSGTVAHADTTGKTTDDHHAKSHAHSGADGSGTVAHADTTGKTANDHHNQSHGNADHTTTGTPGASAVGDSAAQGASASVARLDHVHGREAFASPSTVGTSNAAGSATTIPHSDHVHDHGASTKANAHRHGDVDTTQPASMKATILLQGWQPTTTSGCTASSKQEIGSTNKHDFYACAFATAAESSAFLHHPMPDNWDAGTVTFRVWWFSKTGYVATTSDGVAWGLKAVSYGDSDAIDTAFGTEVVVTDTETADNQACKTADSSALTIGNTPSAGDLIHWVLTRKTADAADDLAADAYVIGVVVEYGVSALSS